MGQGSTGVFTHTTKNVLGGYLAVPYITATANTTVSESTQEVDVIGTSGIITLTFDNTSNLLGSAAKTVTVRNRGAFDVTLSRGSQSWEWSDMTGTNTTTNKTLAAGEQATMFWIDGGVTDYYVLHKIPATFSGGGGGISSLNALTGATQTFATGTSGSNFNISSVGTTHTFNIPDADLGTRGLVTASPQIIDGKKTFVGNIEVGDVGSTEGQIGIASSFGTTVTLTTSPSSGTWSMTLPTGAGSNGQVMTTNGSGVTSWTSVSGDITNGGNSTGAAVTIGTNDNNALGLETNGVPRLSISSGASTGGVLTATNVTSNTNTVQDALVIQTNSSGTAATNFGSGILFQGESTTTDNRDIARISSLWSQATDASREGRISFQLGDNGGALTEVMSINRSAAASGGMVLGTSNPLTVTEASFTVGGNYVFGNASGQVTLGGSTGAIVVNNTSTGPITIHNSVNAATSTAGISIGSTTNFTQTSGTRNYMNFPYSFSPTSGTASHRQLVFSGTFNQTGGANGITNSIRISPTITAVADYRALEIRANGNNVRGIYQTGPNVRNYLYGKTYFGDTIVTPTAQVHFAAGTTSAGSAPIKLTSGTNMTTPEAGAVEWDGTNLYVTQTTGPTRKTVAYSGYKVYTALMSQTGTSAPTAKVLENTLGGTVVWTRNSAGRYTATLSGAFTADKTAFFTAPRGTNADAFPFTASFVRIDANTIEMFSNDLITGKSDAILNDVTIEIRVYN